MSISTQPLSDPPNPPAKGVSITTLLLSLALAISTTAAIVLAVVHFLQPAPGGGGSSLPADGGGGSNNPATAVVSDEPLVQKDTVSPQNKYTGIVYYPIPYDSPPNLKFTSAKRQYDIVKQDETGFTWMARYTLDDLNEDTRKKEGEGFLKNRSIDFVAAHLKLNIHYEDFTYEAKGVRAGKGAGGMRTFEQTGTFTTVAGKDGEVNFKIPYAIAPNVELSGNPSGKVIIVECRPTGFKWKNGGDNDFLYSGAVTWQAKGIRATDIPKPKPD